jgi:hypothetical protein
MIAQTNGSSAGIGAAFGGGGVAPPDAAGGRQGSQHR